MKFKYHYGEITKGRYKIESWPVDNRNSTPVGGSRPYFSYKPLLKIKKKNVRRRPQCFYFEVEKSFISVARRKLAGVFEKK